MGFLLGMGLKMAASRLLSSAFTRSGKEVPKEELDQYRDLDQKFEPKEMPPKSKFEMTPKEQFQNSLGDRGYGLSESESSLYNRLTEDMKIVVDSNYEVANALNKRLDNIEDMISVADHNSRLSAEVAATYGKMGIEATTGVGVKGKSKLASIFSNLLNGAKNAILTAVAAISATSKEVLDYLKGPSPWSGDEDADPELQKNIDEVEKNKEEAKETVKESRYNMQDITEPLDKEDASNLFNSGVYFSKFSESEDYDESLSGLEGFNKMISHFREGSEESIFGKSLSDEEKATFYDTAKAYKAEQDKLFESESIIKNADKALQELKGTRGLASFEKRGFTAYVAEINKLKDEQGKLPLQSRYTLEGKIIELKKKAVELFSDDDLKEMHITRSSNPSNTYEELLKAYESTRSSAYHDLKGMPHYKYEGFQDMMNTRDVTVEAIQNGTLDLYKDGEVLDPTKVDIGKLFSTQSGLGLDLFNSGYSIADSLTGETLTSSNLSDFKRFEGMTRSSSDISEFRDTISDLGVTVDDIKGMSTKEFEDLSSKVTTGNEVILYMLKQIWESSQSNNVTNVIVASEGSGMEPQ